MAKSRGSLIDFMKDFLQLINLELVAGQSQHFNVHDFWMNDSPDVSLEFMNQSSASFVTAEVHFEHVYYNQPTPRKRN